MQFKDEIYTFLFQVAPLGIIAIESDGKVMDTNPYFRELAGFGALESGNDFSLRDKIFKETDILSSFQKCISTGEPIFSECTFYNSNIIKFINYYFIPYKSPTGVVSGAYGIFMNITRHKEIEEEVKKISNYYSDILSGISPLVTLKLSNEIRFVNDSFISEFQLKKENVLNKDIFSVLHLSEKDREIMKTELKQPRKNKFHRSEFTIGEKIYGYTIFSLNRDTAILFRNITENYLLEKKIDDLYSKLLSLQENERRKIASELHDSVGQTILAAKLNFSSYELDNHKYGDRFQAGMDLINRASQELREIYSNLYPSVLRDLGLESATRSLVKDFAGLSSLEVETNFQIKSKLSHDLELNLYRIIQEIFTNILKHAEAISVKLSLKESRKQLYLSISDDGKGFNLDEARKKAGRFGLENIMRRTRELAGECEIETTLNSGCSYKIRIPLIEENLA